MRFVEILLGSLFFVSSAFALDLEELWSQPFVLRTKRIELPDYPHAFNPSMIRWQGRTLLSFRVIPDRKSSFVSWIGLVELDEDFEPIGEIHKLEMRPPHSSIPSRADDARLFAIEERLYLIYSDNEEPMVSKGGFRVYMAEIFSYNGKFFLDRIDRFSTFEGESRNRREKNWTPFEYSGELLFAYSLSPHKIFYPIIGTGRCVTYAETDQPLMWSWGELRGGTPALPTDDGDYLAFFHSSTRIATVHSEGEEIDHYFMGAYTFSEKPPFTLTRISPEPIVAKGFYSGASYQPYWKKVKVIFPCGYFSRGSSLFVAYGRDDHELWIAELDGPGLFESLRNL